ncbi:hypothetical protein ACVCAH_37680, partial [Micromonospora sp. LZ34]
MSVDQIRKSSRGWAGGGPGEAAGQVAEGVDELGGADNLDLVSNRAMAAARLGQDQEPRVSRQRSEPSSSTIPSRV